MPDLAPDLVAERLRPALLRLSRLLRRESDHLGVSHIDAMIMGALRLVPGQGLNELAAREQTRAPTMSAHIKRLEAQGLVERRAGVSGDLRRVSLHLTTEGERLIEAVRDHRTGWLSQRLADLSADDLATLDRAAALLSDMAT